MKRLFLYTIKQILMHPGVIGWGILFILFWGVIGAYIGGPQLVNQLLSSPSLKDAPATVQQSVEHMVYLQYTSGWYANLVIMSLSAIATGVASVLYYQTGTLPYLIRYSKLKTSTYFISTYSGNLIASLVLEALLTAVTVYMFSNNSVGITATPSKIKIIIPTILLGSIFFVSFSTLLDLIIIKLHAYKFQNLFNYIPLILGFLAFAIFTYVTLKSSAVYYSNPYMAIEILLYYGYFGSFKFANATGVETTLNLSLPMLFLSIVAWTSILNIINYILLRKMYYVSLEEGRMI